MAVIIALSSFGLILVSIGGGLFLRYKLPDSHLSGDSKDVIRLATALIGTMAAVVVALLFSSTRSTYEATRNMAARKASSCAVPCATIPPRPSRRSGATRRR